MSRIRGQNSSLDLAMKRILASEGIEFEMYPDIRGHPDFAVGNVLIFCDSSFWHGRHWKRLRGKLEGGSNAPYWVAHIAKNRQRDRRTTLSLKREGYVVLRFWDDDIFKRPSCCSRSVKTAAGLS